PRAGSRASARRARGSPWRESRNESLPLRRSSTARRRDEAVPCDRPNLRAPRRPRGSRSPSRSPGGDGRALPPPRRARTAPGPSRRGAGRGRAGSGPRPGRAGERRSRRPRARSGPAGHGGRDEGWPWCVAADQLHPDSAPAPGNRAFPLRQQSAVPYFIASPADLAVFLAFLVVLCAASLVSAAALSPAALVSAAALSPAALVSAAALSVASAALSAAV